MYLLCNRYFDRLKLSVFWNSCCDICAKDVTSSLCSSQENSARILNKLQEGKPAENCCSTQNLYGSLSSLHRIPRWHGYFPFIFSILIVRVPTEPTMIFSLYFVFLTGAHMPGAAGNRNILASEGCFRWEFLEYLAVCLK